MTTTQGEPFYEDFVLWVGPMPNAVEAGEFANRGLKIAVLDEYHLPAFATANALVIRYDPENRGANAYRLGHYLPIANAHGLRAFFYAPTETVLPPQIHNAVVGQKINLRLFGGLGGMVAVAVERDRIRPASLALVIQGGEDLDEEEEALLRRAFNDCDEVRLTRLPGGRSAKTYCCYAIFSLETGYVGRRPLPFFVKFDTRKKIEKERTHYQTAVSHFIPFNHRPNLKEDRTHTGGDRGVLVGTFIEQSEALCDVLSRGGPADILYSLFEHALRGWRLQAYGTFEDLSPSAAADNHWQMLTKDKWLGVNRFHGATWARAQAMGATVPPQDLVDALKQVDEFMFVGPTHSDLHANNVRAYGHQAIIIDFNAQNRGPIVADPAMLEISLVFARHGVADGQDGWAAMVDKLYTVDHLQQAPPPAISPLPREWLWTAVRLIRTLSLPSERLRHEYTVALAIYLVRHAAFGPDTAHPDELERRAYAYMVAERLAAGLGTLT